MKNKEYIYETNLGKEYPIFDDDIDFLSEPEWESLFPDDEIIVEKNELKVLSLFSGCGGMDIGLEGDFICATKSITDTQLIDFPLNKKWVKLKPTGLKTVFACDIMAEARIAWVNYMRKRGIPPSIYHLSSIVELVNKHKSGINIFPKDIDIITGGFPCQDFSVAGKRRGFDSKILHDGKKNENNKDPNLSRGKLYSWMKEVIEIIKPKMFLAENVKGLVSLGCIKDIIREDFSKASQNGYFIFEPRVLHAADYGVPESRERVIFIGVRKDALKPEIKKILEEEDIPAYLDPYPFPTHSDDEMSALPKRVKCEDVLSDLDEPENSIDLSHHFYSKAKYLDNGSQGQTEINYKGIGPTIRSEHHGNIEFRRLSLEHGGKNFDEISMGMKERRLTPRECALIQTFPRDYNFVLYKSKNNRFAVSPSMAYKIIGNAVPPMLAYNLALRIKEIWPLYFKN